MKWNWGGETFSTVISSHAFSLSEDYEEILGRDVGQQPQLYIEDNVLLGPWPESIKTKHHKHTVGS